MGMVLSLGIVAGTGYIGYMIGDYYGGDMAMKLGAMAGVMFGALVVAAVKTKAL